MMSPLFNIPETERERQQFIQRRKSKPKETSIQRDFKGSEASWQKGQDHSPSGEDRRGLAFLQLWVFEWTDVFLKLRIFSILLV